MILLTDTQRPPTQSIQAKPAKVQFISFTEAHVHPFNTRQDTDYQTNKLTCSHQKHFTTEEQQSD